MKSELKISVKGIEELKELLDSAVKQAIELQETLDRISQPQKLELILNLQMQKG